MKYRGGCAGVPPHGVTAAAGHGSDAAARLPEPAAVAEHEEQERHDPEAQPEQHRTEPRGRVHLRVLRASGRRSPSSDGAPARRLELRPPVRRRPAGRARGRPRRRVGGAGGSSVACLGGRGERVRSVGLTRHRASPSRVSIVPSAPSSHRTISWVSDTSLENSAPTDSPRWMRRIASPMSGATDRVVILASRLRSGSGTESVRTTSRRLEAAIRSIGRVAQHAVGGAGVDLGHAFALERPGDLDERAGGVDLVVDDDRALALDVADDVHQLGPVEVADAALLDDRQRRVEQLGERPGALGEAEVGDDDRVLDVLVAGSSSRACGRRSARRPGC